MLHVVAHSSTMRDTMFFGRSKSVAIYISWQGVRVKGEPSASIRPPGCGAQKGVANDMSWNDPDFWQDKIDVPERGLEPRCLKVVVVGDEGQMPPVSCRCVG